MTAKKSKRLPDVSEKRLLAYAMVGAGALAAPAHAGVIVTDVSPDQLLQNGALSIDLNNDAIPDFTLNNNAGIGFRYLFVTPALGNFVVGTGTNAAVLNTGTSVGPGSPFSTTGSMAFQTSSGAGINVAWNNVTDRFLGFQFQISGQTFYGWALLDVSSASSPLFIDALLKAYAYESTAGVPILTGAQAGPGPGAAPEPGTLTLLALGTIGLAAWRKRRASAE